MYNEKEDILQYDITKKRRGVHTLGKLAQYKTKWQINDQGFNSITNYSSERKSDKPLVAIIGDSYVEGYTVDVDKHLGVMLQNRIDADVYQFGFSGSALSDYLRISRYVRSIYRPDVITFLLVHNDFDELFIFIYPLRINICNIVFFFILLCFTFTEFIIEVSKKITIIKNISYNSRMS